MNYPAPAPAPAAPVPVTTPSPANRTTADLMNWRNLPQYQPPGLRQNLTLAIEYRKRGRNHNMPAGLTHVVIATGQGALSSSRQSSPNAGTNSDAQLQNMPVALNPAGMATILYSGF
jgi:hypothetical protein